MSAWVVPNLAFAQNFIKCPFYMFCIVDEFYNLNLRVTSTTRARQLGKQIGSSPKLGNEMLSN